MPVSITCDGLNVENSFPFDEIKKKTIWSVDFLDLPVNMLSTAYSVDLNMEKNGTYV